MMNLIDEDRLNKARVRGEIYVPMKYIVPFHFSLSIALPLSNIFDGHVGEPSLRSVFLAYFFVVWALIFWRLSNTGRVVFPLWLIVFLFVIEIVILFYGRSFFGH